MVQNVIVRKVTNILSAELGSKVEVGYFSTNFVNSISLENILIEDQKGDTLLHSEELSARFKLLPLLSKSIEIDKITLSDPDIQLKNDSTNGMNFQFIVDKFKTNSAKSSTLKLKIEDIEISNGNLSYCDKDKKTSHNYKYLDLNNIEVENINVDASFFISGSNVLNGVIKKLYFKERSGFSLDNLMIAFALTDSMASIPTLNIETGNSMLSMKSVSLKYGSLKKLKQDIRQTKCLIELNPSVIYPTDFKTLHPVIGGFTNTLTLNGKIEGRIDNLLAKGLSVSYGNELRVAGDIEAIGLPDIHNTFFHGNVDLKFSKNSIQDIIANVSKKPVLLPKELNALGNCAYKGTITGFVSDIVLYGNMRSNVGNISTDLQVKMPEGSDVYKIKGKIASKGISVHKLFPASGVGKVSFAINSEVSAGKGTPFVSNSKVNISSIMYNNYIYKDINLEGLITESSFEGKLNIDDPNAYLSFDGKINVDGENKSLIFDSKIDRLNLSELNLIKGYEDLVLGVNLKADFYGTKWENMDGFCSIDSISLKRSSSSKIIEHIGIKAQTETSSHILVDGDLIEGDIFGLYALETIKESLLSVLGEQMPIINKTGKAKVKKENQFSFYFDIAPTNDICNLLDIPWYTKKTTTLQGQFNDQKSIFFTDLSIPNFSNGKMNINNIHLYCDNRGGINLSLNAATKLKTDSLYAGIEIHGIGDEILSSVRFDNKKQNNLSAGELTIKTLIKEIGDSLTAQINILPSTLIAKNKRWDLNYSSIFTDFQSARVDSFSIAGGDQHIHIDGDISSSSEDSVEIVLVDINLDDISDLLPEKTALHFGGRVNGKAYISNALSDRPIIEADVLASKFMFNKSYFGKAHVTSNFDTQENCLLFNGIVQDDYNTQNALLDGKYYFLKDSLDIKGDANKLDMQFLNYYLSSILDDVRGKATGNVHIYGITKAKTIAIDAATYIQEAQVGIAFLNTTYYFSDSIYMNSREIRMQDIELMDTEGNKATLNGLLTHRYLKGFAYDIDINTKNVIALNTTKKESENFFGKVYATGDVNITGDEIRGTRISCKARTDENSKVAIPMDSYFAADNSFITFIGDNHQEEKKEEEKEEELPNNNNLFLDLMLDVQPNADISLLVNSKTGDMIKANGNGNIRLTYDLNNNDMKMYGSYSITQGEYIFTFQNALRKEFNVMEGSTIAWSAGGPTDAEIDIKAYYQINASLNDIIDQSILDKSSRTSTAVQCILNLTGNLMQPSINFDIELPNADDEIRRAVDNVLNTEELVNRQTVSLLVLGKFMGLEYATNNTVNTENEIYSVMSSTLSSMLNSWASQLFDKWNFGINYRPGDQGTIADEYEFNFLYTPNNRVTINGNVGYKDDALSTNKFIGDFDIEYKLFQSGKLSLKAYTHTNDYNEFKQSNTTQGAGIIYRESFNSGKELWNGWVESSNERKEKRKKRRAERKEKKTAKTLKEKEE